MVYTRWARAEASLKGLAWASGGVATVLGDFQSGRRPIFIAAPCPLAQGQVFQTRVTSGVWELWWAVC